MNIFDMKKSDFKDIPVTNDTVKDFDDVVIIPTNRKHDSGYRCMEFVFCEKGEPFVKSFGGSDVLNLNGIGGYGKWKGYLPTMVQPIGWNIDCLPCGYLHIWCNKKLYGDGCSSYEVIVDE